MASSLTYTYYIKQSTQGDESYLAPSGATDITQNTYTFTGLQQGTSYDVKVEVKSDVAGNTGTGTLINQTTASIPGGSEGVTQGAITFGTPGWNGGQASITVSTNTNYQIEYKLNAPEIDEGWTSIDNKGAISGLGHGSTVYARLTDGTNHGDYATANVTDSVKPVVTVTAQGTATSNSLSVSVSAVDNESGMASSLTYTYYIKQTSELDESYVAKASNIATNTYIFSGLTQGTSYDIKVEVTGDNAGNTGAGTLLNQTTAKIPDASGEEMQEGAITFSTPSWSGGKASVIVSTNTTYQIEYQIGGIEGSWTSIENNGTIPNLDNGTTVYARLTDGVNHGEYASVTVQDTTPPTVSLSTSATYNSITVTVNASDNETGLATSGTYKYYLNNSLKTTSTSNSYTFTGLSAQTGYSIKVEVTNGVGVVGTRNTSVTTSKKPAENIDEVGEAEYVNYVDATGTTRLCAILYDSYSDYGVEIITKDIVEHVTMGTEQYDVAPGTSEFNKSKNDYNNAINILNTAARKYNNSTYSTSARCVGSLPSNPDYDGAGMYYGDGDEWFPEEYFNDYKGMFKAEDTYYEEDFEQMTELGIAESNEHYWMASRSIYDSATSYAEIHVKLVSWYSGSLAAEEFFHIGEDEVRGEGGTNGLRPVFKLRSNVKITGGSGTESDPYTLGV